MTDQNTKKLEKRIAELEAELRDRTQDLAVFREELQNANLKLAAFIAQISQELKVASLIQKALVPTEFPNIPGFEFSTKFVASSLSGGDYFDIFEHDDKFRFGIVVSNSSGYGMSALFLSVLLKMTGRLEARKGASPEKVLQMMGQELVPNIKTKDLAHVFYGVFDRRGFDLSYASAGHTIALLLNASTGKLQRLESGAPPFAAESRSEIPLHTISLNPRDRLILCTEGVIKALNPKGEMFGEDRLYKTVLGAPRAGVHDLRNEILFQIEKFRQSRELPNDLTVIVTEVKDRVLKLAKSADSASS